MGSPQDASRRKRVHPTRPFGCQFYLLTTQSLFVSCKVKAAAWSLLERREVRDVIEIENGQLGQISPGKDVPRPVLSVKADNNFLSSQQMALNDRLDNYLYYY